MSSTEQRIRQQLKDHPIILYMKGVPEQPECGFSAKAVAALKATGIPYTYVNVLGSPFIRERLPKVSKWPTFPQLFVKGELIGGCDIIEAMAEQGTLLAMLQAAAPVLTEQSATITPDEVEHLIKQDYPDAEIDISGEGCDLAITVVSQCFEGQSMVKQQQGVMAALTEALSSGRLHAVTIKAYTPTQWQERLVNHGLLQIQV